MFDGISEYEGRNRDFFTKLLICPTVYFNLFLFNDLILFHFNDLINRC